MSANLAHGLLPLGPIVLLGIFFVAYNRRIWPKTTGEPWTYILRRNDWLSAPIVAVALAAQVISVYPFDQPDVESAKELTRNLLASGNTDSQAVLAPAQESGPGIDSGVDLLRQAGPGDYVAILGYIPASADVEDAVSGLRAAITRKTGAATTFGYGPRYLHSTGQLHKGGPASVIGRALAAGNEDALAAPGAEHGFESLFIAQLSGDVEALRSNGRRSSVTVLRTPYADAIRGIAADLERA